MARQTKKFVAGVETAQGLGITDFDDHEALYDQLNQHNFFWDATDQRWGPGSEPEPATELIRVRVWAETTRVADVANMLVRRMSGYTLIEKSKPYVCRPPNQLESRIYLVFMEEKG